MGTPLQCAFGVFVGEWLGFVGVVRENAQKLAFVVGFYSVRFGCALFCSHMLCKYSALHQNIIRII